VLHTEGADHVLRAVSEERLLRDDGQDARRGLRLPLESHAAATEAAWHAFHAQLRAFVSRRVRDAADADDIVQRVFLQMHRSVADIRDGDRLGAWLYRASRNAIADYYRAPASRREIPSGDTRELDSRDMGDVDAVPADEAQCAAECLRSLVAGLPRSYRLAIEQVEIEGLSQKAAAAAQGISLSGMKARVQRGRRRLKALLVDRCRVAVDRRGGVVGCETDTTSGSGCSGGVSVKGPSAGSAGCVLSKSPTSSGNEGRS
jgi:RNA polymerase sigma-70 factor (ECF subfamily)